jgi:hypothetical protein
MPIIETRLAGISNVVPGSNHHKCTRVAIEQLGIEAEDGV